MRVPELGDLSHLAPPRGRSALSAVRSADGAVKLDELQLKGSHNSYHRAPRLALSRTWRYSHPPLEVQLASHGIRQLELDVRNVQGELMVSHLPIVDGRSNCGRLRECLARIRTWSRAHPDHVPVFVFIEIKEDLAPSQLEGRLDLLDLAIRRALPRNMLLIPGDVVGDAPSLHDAIVNRGWPALDDVRGRTAFVLFGARRHRRAYARGRPRLDGRVMFVAEQTEARPHASVLMYDDPIRRRVEIDAAVSRHFLVRTRADLGLRRDRARLAAALASGAHFISSDFADPRFHWLEPKLAEAARCNPRSASNGCSALAVSERDRAAMAAVAPER